eukprot:g12630.t1
MESDDDVCEVCRPWLRLKDDLHSLSEVTFAPSCHLCGRAWATPTADKPWPPAMSVPYLIEMCDPARLHLGSFRLTRGSGAAPHRESGEGHGPGSVKNQQHTFWLAFLFFLLRKHYFVGQHLLLVGKRQTFLFAAAAAAAVGTLPTLQQLLLLLEHSPPSNKTRNSNKVQKNIIVKLNLTMQKCHGPSAPKCACVTAPDSVAARPGSEILMDNWN